MRGRGYLIPPWNCSERLDGRAGARGGHTLPGMPSGDSRPILLASGSPRRRELLTRAGVRFEVRPAQIDETPRRGEPPAALATRLAQAKAMEVARRSGAAPARLVLGADTIVILEDRVLGKPRDSTHAIEMLEALAGRTHRVLTAVALVRSDRLEPQCVQVESRVSMRRADAEEIRAYVATGEPLDKAGAYAVQGQGRSFVERIEGSETNVIGLPIDETLALLGAAGAAIDPA
jgi:nucleoside triphosphate pyrophosphatase